MANPLIKITNIKRDFPLGNEIVYVLKGIDLEINKGEYVALMGPSGSGKSTLMNILGCLDTPTSGTYVLNGKHVSEMQDDELAGIRNKEIGFVFQTFNLMPRTTALDNVALPMVYAGHSKSERVERATEVLTQVGLNDRMDHKPNQLSGGQRQRISIARAILANPSIFILDEATSNLDTESETMIQNSLNELMKDRTTFVIAHRLSTIRKADQILVIENGHIVERGNHDELIAKEGRYYELFTYQSRI